MERICAEPLPTERLDHDLGLGGKMSDRSRVRLLKSRWHLQRPPQRPEPVPPVQRLSTLLSFPCRTLLALMAAGYVVTNLLFACLYWLAGPGAISGAGAPSGMRASRTASSSASRPSPRLAMARSFRERGRNVLVAVEALVRSPWLRDPQWAALRALTRPTAKIRFSERADRTLRGRVGLMFPPVNLRSHDLTDVHAVVSYARWVDDNGTRHRRSISSPSSEDGIIFSTALGHRPPDHGDQPVARLTSASLVDADPEIV